MVLFLQHPPAESRCQQIHFETISYGTLKYQYLFAWVTMLLKHE